MTKRFLPLLFAFLAGMSGVAAQPDPELDSMRRLYTALQADGSGRNADELAEVCADLSEYYCYRSADSAIRYARTGLGFLEEGKNPSARLVLLNNMAVPYFTQGDSDRAIELFKQACDIAVGVGDEEALINIYNSLGVCYRSVNCNREALDCYRKALELALHTEDFATIASLNANIAVLYSFISRDEEGYEYACKAVDAAEKSGDRVQIIYSQTVEGSILLRLKRYEESIDMLRETLPQAEAIGAPELYVKCVTPILQAFDRLGMTDSVALYLAKAAPWMEYIPEQSVEARHILETEAALLYSQGRYRESLAAYQRLRAINEAYDLPSEHQVSALIGLSYAQMGNFRNAFESTREAYLEQDSLFSHTIQKELSDLTVRYRTQEKELEIARLQQAEAEQRARMFKRTALLTVCLAALVLLVLLLLYLRRRQLRRNERLEAQSREREREFADFRKDTDLRLARKYIDGLESERERLARELHDGACNDLLGVELVLDESLPAGEPLGRIRGLLERSRSNLRHISHALMPPMFQYAALDEMLEDYVAHVPHPASLRIVFRRTEEFDWSCIPETTAYEVYRIVQEALSNVMRHARATRVEVSLEICGGRFTLTVADDGRGFDPATVGDGVGMRTVRDRVRSFGGSCELRSDGAGTCLVVTGDTGC